MKIKIIHTEDQFWKFKYVISAPKEDSGRVWITCTETLKDDPETIDENEIVIIPEALRPLIAALEAALKESEGK